MRQEGLVLVQDGEFGGADVEAGDFDVVGGGVGEITSASGG